MTEIAWDCIVVGGGAAGLSAALVLGRARRRTLLVDAGRPSNAPARGIGGLLGHDGRPPAALYAIGREELAAYPSVRLVAGEVERGERVGDGFALELAGRGRELARRVLLATGMDYRPPELPGLEELWGDTVFHCPFCHGWEMRDRPLAVLGGAEAHGPYRALLLRGWSEDVVLLADGPADLAADDRARLADAGVAVDERPVAGLVARDGRLAAIAFADGGRLAREGLLVAAPLRRRSGLAEQLGAASAGPGAHFPDQVAVDGLQRADAPGLFVAGDLGAGVPQVAGAIASGSAAAAAIVQSLVAEDHGLPFPPGPPAQEPVGSSTTTGI